MDRGRGIHRQVNRIDHLQISLIDEPQFPVGGARGLLERREACLYAIVGVEDSHLHDSGGVFPPLLQFRSGYSNQPALGIQPQ
jgi:hypothetical protein